jgi:peptidyl-prolyl cis-trans isomerase C
MRPLKIMIAASGIALAVAASAPVLAQSDKVLARVNGVAITEADVTALRDQLGPALAKVPESERGRLWAELVQYLIESMLIGVAVEKEKLTQSPEYKAQLEFYRQRAMREFYMNKRARDTVKEADARKFYDEKIGQIKPETEVRVRHILVATEEEAHEIIERLGRGADFAELAKEKSTAPSRVQGGDLGYFTASQAPKEFSDAAFALEKGGVSEPVETEQGWNVIKLEDKREKKPPAFDDVKSEILEALIQQKQVEVMTGLQEKADIEIVDSDIAKAMGEAARGSFSQ